MLKFGTSGIRGIFNREFSLEAINRLSYAINKNFGGRIGVVYDTRRSSRVLASGIMAGLSYYGSDVVSFGVLPTPVAAFLTRELGLDAGLILTASHNPPEYVGIKIFDNEGIEIESDLEGRIEQDMELYKEKSSSKIGSIECDYFSYSKYIHKAVLSFPNLKKRLRIVVDSGNGTTNQYTPRILTKLGHSVITVNSHQHSYSLGRTLEPKVDTLKETADLVRAVRADIGIAHDGDGDRTVLIDETGRVLEYQVLSLLALKNISRKGSRIVISVNTSNSVQRLAERVGFQVKRAKLGKTFLEMKRINGVFATEPSKVTDASWGMWEDGIYIATKIIQYLSNSRRKFSSIVNNLSSNFWYQQNLSVKGIDKSDLEQKVLKKYKEEKVDRLDGWKIVFNDNSFLLFRLSGTEPKVRIYADAPNKKKAINLLNEGVKLVKNVCNYKVGYRK